MLIEPLWLHFLILSLSNIKISLMTWNSSVMNKQKHKNSIRRQTLFHSTVYCSRKHFLQDRYFLHKPCADIKKTDTFVSCWFNRPTWEMQNKLECVGKKTFWEVPFKNNTSKSIILHYWVDIMLLIGFQISATDSPG